VFRAVCIALCLSFSTVALAEIAGFPFKNEAQEERFETLASQLRCLVCQNQSLADSDAPLAQDLRSELYEQIQTGNSNDQIISFLTGRYGDFILYKPAFNARTLLLWLSPLLLFIIGVVCLFRFNLKSGQEAEGEVSEADLQKIRELLESEIENK
jgi:cytochrome c-type biogenesis protein CcmH